MNQSKPPHPLFDPASTYSRMRKSVRPQYKMRGYFHWQKARAIRLDLPLPEREPDREDERRSDLRRLASRVAGTPGGERTVAVLPDGLDLRVTDAVDVRPLCLRRGPCFGGAVGALFLVSEADGTRTVGMWVELDELASRQPVACRAFLVEPGVLARLQEVIQTVCNVGPDRALVHAFEAETIAGNTDVARLLAALPDLDGEARDHEMRFHRLPIADEFDTFPPRPGPLTVVVACDDPAAP